MYMENYLYVGLYHENGGEKGENTLPTNQRPPHGQHMDCMAHKPTKNIFKWVQN